MKSGQGGASTTNVLATIALVFSALTGWVAQFHSHCSSHEGSMQVAAGHPQHQTEHPSPAWTNPHRHDCNHCAPSECSRAAPCSMSAGGVLIATLLSPSAPPPHGISLPSRYDPQPLAPVQPPTPPPQLVS
jgi:hypothetical protein